MVGYEKMTASFFFEEVEARNVFEQAILQMVESNKIGTK